MLHPYMPLTAEDSAIWERFPFAARKAAHIADQHDARIMLDLGFADADKRGLTVRLWVESEALDGYLSGYVVREYEPEDFEHVVMAEECQHGFNLDMLEDHPSMCPDCWDDSHSDELPADSWAGGFAENH